MSEPAYVTLAFFKESMGILDDDRDEQLQQRLDAASRGVDSHCGRRFHLDDIPAPRTLRIARRVVVDQDGPRLLIPDIGTTTGLVVELGRPGAWRDITTEVEPIRDHDDDQTWPYTSLARPGGWHAAPGTRARITARWGWPAIPTAVEMATVLQASRLWNRRNSPEGITGSAEWGGMRLTRVDPDVGMQLQRLVLPAFA
ncbi:head-tail connector protein [Embleya sp. NPDC127516]|uniref:head-tail connector protein n=1 Tax=Embleya sp. NPDC127516 TaxID=3363990 RepID=UPI00381D0870